MTSKQYLVLTSLGFALVMAIIFLAGILLRGQSREEEYRRFARQASQRQPDRPEEVQQANPDPATPDVLPEGRRSSDPVDVLGLLDPNTDSVHGEWAIRQGVLFSPKLPFARLQIPYVPPREYDVEVSVVRESGSDSFNFGVAAGKNRCVVIIDGMEKGDTTGVDLIAKKGFMENPTTRKGKLLYPGERARIVYSIRHKALMVKVNGETIIDWFGDFETTSMFRGWKTPDPRAVFIGAFDSVFRIEEMRITPVNGEGLLLR